MKSSICNFFRNPVKHLDKKSYIGIYISLFFQSIIGLFLFSLISGNAASFSELGLIRKLLFVLVSLYLIWIIIMTLFADIKRFRYLKVPGWAMLFSFPFGFGIMKLAGAFCPDFEKDKNKFETKFNWYNQFISFLSDSKNGQMVLAFVITLISLFIYPVIFVFSVLCFWIPAAVIGLSALRDSFKKFAINLMILNLIFIIITFITAGTLYNMQPMNPSLETSIHSAEIQQVAQPK